MHLESAIILMLLLVARAAGAACGNGHLQGSEQCDDGNIVSGDGCDSTCKIQPYYSCATGTPSLCKIDAAISLSAVGMARITSSNTGVFLFKPNYQLDIFKSINFNSIFVTSIAASAIQVEYISNSNLIKATIAYQTNIENTLQSFQLRLTSTNRFWYDSQAATVELHGANCELTFQDNLWLSSTLFYVFLGVIVISLGVGFASIFFEKWIGLELIQTYQSAYYMLMLLQHYPFEFSPLSDTLRFSNGYDDIFSRDFEQSYTLPSQLNGLSIQKEFLANININICLIVAVSIILIVLAIKKTMLTHRLQSEVNRKINKKIEKVNKYFAFMFGEVFILLVLALMFKIINSFTVQLSRESDSYEIFADEVNTTLAIFTFLILFSVIIFIFNWYIMIPDNLTEDQVYSSLQFRNMKFYYPVVYLTYQLVFILLVSIYYHRSYILYILLALQVSYFAFIVFLWPYNTPRKTNRILHNATILFNQFILILMAALTFRWKALIAGSPSPATSTEFIVYLFFIFGFLLCSTVLTVIRLCIFNKDVQCTHREKNDHEEQAALNGNILLGELAKKDSNISNPQEENARKNSSTETVSHFLNDKYSNWKRENAEEIKRSKLNNRVRKVRKTNSKFSELIKTPLDELTETKMQAYANNRVQQQK